MASTSTYSDTIEDALAVHRKLAKVPTVGQACFTYKPGDNKGTRTLELLLKSKDLENEEDVQKRISIPMQLKNLGTDWRWAKPPLSQAVTNSPSVSPVPCRLDPIVAQKVDTTPFSTTRIVLREIPDSKNPQSKKRFVEVYEGAARLFSRDVTPYHRNFITDDIFGSLDIHAASRTALYSAEANHPKDHARFEYVPSLGEKTGDNVRPSVFLLRWAGPSGTAFHADSFKPRKSYLFGPLNLIGWTPRVVKGLVTQAVILPDHDSRGANYIVATARCEPENRDRKGTVYCNNRLSTILRIPMPKFLKAEELNPWSLQGQETHPLSEDLTRSIFDDITAAKYFAWRRPFVRVGKYFSDGTVTKYQQRIYFQGTECGGAHNDYTAVGIYVYQTTVQNGRTRVKESGTYTDCKRKFFQGREVENPYLYIGEESQEDGPRVSDLDQYLLNSQRIDKDHLGYCVRVVTINSASAKLPDGRITMVIDANEIGVDVNERSNEILCTDGQRLFATSFSSARTCDMEVAVRSIQGPTIHSKSEQVYHSREDVDDFSKLTEKVLSSSQEAENERNEFLERAYPGSMVLVPRHLDSVAKAPPSIIMPHGGPHDMSTLAFSPEYCALMLLGYQIIFPNYPGSIGKDSDYVQELIGNCGTKDVDYCYAITKDFVERKWASAKHLYVLGGSYGGFIAAHLIQRYPTMFKAAVMRNPVIDIASMAVNTDIPDWCYRELNIEYTPPAWGRVVQPHAYQRMHEASPVVGWDKVKADVLLLVGKADKRVPPQQSQMYFAALQTEEFITVSPTPTDKNTVQMLCFDDADHALDTPEAQRYGFEAMLKLFEKTAKAQRWHFSAFRRPGDNVAVP